MDWGSAVKGFAVYLQLEKSLSRNTIAAYRDDINKLHRFLSNEEGKASMGPLEVGLKELRAFVKVLAEAGVAASSQARIISGIRAFYRFCLLEDLMKSDPTELLEMPRLGRKLPEVLSPEEIEKMIRRIDHSKPEGVRNHA